MKKVVENPFKGNIREPIQDVLRDVAECLTNKQGVLYVKLVEAADYIDKLEDDLFNFHISKN